MSQKTIFDYEPEKIKKEKTIFDFKPEEIIEEKPKGKRKERKKHEPVSGEKDYKWCYEAELPVITATFEKGKLIEEKTNNEIVR